MRPLRVGVAGLGVVGSQTVRILRARAADFERRLGAPLELAWVCDRRAAAEAKRLGLPRSVRRTTRWEDLGHASDVDIVVETMGGLEEARGLVLVALAAGKHVVTANKRLLAHHWEEIFRAASRTGRQVRFEASVAGGIPIVQALHRSLAANRVGRVLGILNGTTNFILTRMAHEGLSFDAAVKEAQRLGLAERDPTLDLDGTDAAHKVAVLASLLTGRWVRPESVARAGIQTVTAADIRFAVSTLGRTTRLLGSVEIDWDARPARLCCHVFPTLVPLDHPLAAVHGEYNAVMVETSEAGDLMFYGKGAGGGPAASAVVGDLFMLAEELLSGGAAASGRTLWSERREVSLEPVTKTLARFYLRLQVRDRPGALARIAGLLGSHGISIAQIHQDAAAVSAKGSVPSVPVYLTTHPARHAQMDEARRAILGLSWVGREHCCLRLL